MLYSPPFSAQKKVEEFSVKAEVFDLFAWNLFVLYFGGWTLQNKALFYQNKGHLGSRCIYIYIQFFLLHLQQANPRMVIFFGGKKHLIGEEISSAKQYSLETMKPETASLNLW